MKRLALCIGLLVASAPAWAGEGWNRFSPTTITPDDVRTAMRHGADFLLKSQNPDGSWGGAWISIFTWSGGIWSNPESHRSWRVATTGLACLAFLENAQTDAEWAAVDHSLDYLIANALVKRPSEWDTMDCWAHIYGLQALAAAYGHPRYANSPRRDAIHQAIDTHLRRMAESQSLSGGWGYLEFAEPRTEQPQWATSFTTAAGVVALADAKAAGINVDEAMLARAVKAVRRCRLPNGAFTYSVQAIATPRRIGSIDRINGSLGRIQAGNIALLLAGDKVTEDCLRTGIGHFFRQHRFLDIAMQRPIPHEAYYQNSGYFYLFGHYYAARVIEKLPAADQAEDWPKLRYEVMKIQQADGSMWDYDHHAYAKPYGTAYALLTLGRSLRDDAPHDGVKPAAPTTERGTHGG